MTAMEERLNVPQSSRFPLYKQLMWHAAAFYTACLEAELSDGESALSTAYHIAELSWQMLVQQISVGRS